MQSPIEVRNACRSKKFTSQTSGLAPGYAQANLCILSKSDAFDFLLFCQRNSKSCPLIDVLEPGQRIYTSNLQDIDITTDLPKYRVYIDGKLTEEVIDISNYWRDDFVTFIIGCSFSFEEALIKCGLEVRHITEGKNVPMYNTNISCRSAGKFSGKLVVSMRPFTSDQAIAAVQITSKYPRVHGSPIHIGDPSSIGIVDINKPDYGDSITIKDNELPVFWACGVTPQAIVMNSKPSICITHAPGHMLVLDIMNEQLALS
uniref:Hydro-lyase n=1 Tax=Chromulina nebulosa TaxID=96789 RepID=A0A7S0STY9_9STRA|mmetsp:Transcript_2872/g.2532  ORF Transcript_2872/g.2532 Transcript_2872/m.2532 type:complete len:259 (+) Transcript_2872:12-788(+)